MCHNYRVGPGGVAGEEVQPVTGDDLIDLTDPDVFTHGPPHEIYRSLRDEPTPNTPDGEGFWCLTRYDDVEWAAKHPDVFSSVSGGTREGGGTLIEDLPAGLAAGVLFNMQDDPRHQHVRRIVSPSVTRMRRSTLYSSPIR